MKDDMKDAKDHPNPANPDGPDRTNRDDMTGEEIRDNCKLILERAKSDYPPAFARIVLSLLHRCEQNEEEIAELRTRLSNLSRSNLPP